MSDLISRQAAIDALDKRFDSIPMEQTTEILLLRKDLKKLPTAQPEIHFDEWCTDCNEYDHEKHCCPRFNKVIRRTVEGVKEAQPKTGKWIDVPHTFFTKCSACEWLNDIHDFDYCPNCGAMMKEGD